MVISYILSIKIIEQKCVVLKGLLQSTHLKYHMKNIGISQSLSNSASFEHKCLNNTKEIHQHSGKCDEPQNFKDVLEDAMVSTSEKMTDFGPSLPMTQVLENHSIFHQHV